MSVSHYEEEYDEPIQVNMTAELGEEVAAAVFDGTRFTRKLKQGLISQCNEARRRRAELLTTLDREERRLVDAEADLSDIESALESETPETTRELSFPELSDRWERLGVVEDRCQDLLDEHAATRRNTPEERPEFREYVYRSLPSEYPVLSDGTRLLDRIGDCRRTVLRALTRRA
jgi:DNA repair exonuclease SbcCD ATPase subunit